MTVLKQARLIIAKNKQKFEEFNVLLDNYAKLAKLTVSLKVFSDAGPKSLELYNLHPDALKEAEVLVRSKAKEIMDSIPAMEYHILGKARGRMNIIKAGVEVTKTLLMVATIPIWFIVDAIWSVVPSGSAVALHFGILPLVRDASAKYKKALFTATEASRIALGGEIKEK